jgi:hypothetical protein
MDMRRQISIYIYLTCIICLQCIMTSNLEAHNWRKKKLILFASYELTQDSLNMSLCLPAPLANALFKAPIDFDYLLTDPVMKQIQQQLQDYFREFQPTWIDGVRVFPQWDRIDYVLTAPQNEVEQAMLSYKDTAIAMHTGTKGALIVNVKYPLKTAAKIIKIHWDHPRLFMSEPARRRMPARFNMQKKSEHSRKIMPGVFVYQDQLLPIRFAVNEPEFIWRRPLEKAELPTLQSIQLKPPPVTYHPILALILTILTLLYLLSKRNQLTSLTQQKELYIMIFMIASTWLAKPLQMSFPGYQDKLDHVEARQIFEALHQNIYRAFDYEDDTSIYDALAQSVSGDLLDWIFQNVYQSLILKEEGGARAKVSVVKPLDFKKVFWTKTNQKFLQGTIDTNNHFAVLYRWRTVGEVKHWGHSHRRVNEYEARYLVAYTDQGWRIVKSNALAQNRRIDLEGIN